MKLPRVVQISDRAAVPDDELLGRVARGGPDMAVQLRDPALDARTLLALGRRLREATRDVGAALWVNDRLDLAIVLQADGVHLGRRSPSVLEVRRALGGSAVITVSAHDLDEVAAVPEADAVLLSPIFASPGKSSPLGVEALAAARASLDRLRPGVGLYALGGVEPDRVAACLATGATGVAAIRADLTVTLR